MSDGNAIKIRVSDQVQYSSIHDLFIVTLSLLKGNGVRNIAKVRIVPNILYVSYIHENKWLMACKLTSSKIFGFSRFNAIVLS